MLLEERNQGAVRELYKALISNDTNTVHHLLAPDLEWWFHGPTCHRHHLIPLLTGCASSSSSMANDSVVLVPDIIVGFGSVVIAEGYDHTNLVWWVHAWTVDADDGVITQVREYVNTSLTVTRLGMEAVSSSSSAIVAASSKCQSIWQSRLCDESVPGLILAL